MAKYFASENLKNLVKMAVKLNFLFLPLILFGDLSGSIERHRKSFSSINGYKNMSNYNCSEQLFV